MKRAICILLLALVTTSVGAQEPPPKLDLTLPAIKDTSSTTTASASAAPADLSGNNAVDANDSQPDPNRIDPTKLRVTGGVSTTIGYAKGYGTGISNAAELNISKQTDDGKSFNFHLDVRKSDGFPIHGYSRYPYGW